MFSKEKEHLDLENSESFRDKNLIYWETVLSSRENEKEGDTSNATMPYSIEKAEYEIPEGVTYLKDGQRYDKLDDSLYLGTEEDQEFFGYPEDIKATEEEGDGEDQEYIVYDSEEESEHSETLECSNEDNVYDDPETSISLEEEEEKSMEERKNIFQHVLSSLNLDRNRKVIPEFVKQFSLDRGRQWTPETTEDLAWNFLMKVQALDATARDSILTPRAADESSKEELLTGMENLKIGEVQTINPLDVLCACMLCSDVSLQREVMSKMVQCQFAVPLLLPDAENNKSILMLGAVKDVRKTSEGTAEDAEDFLRLMKVPVISFVRLGLCSVSKSSILNTLLSPARRKPHRVFLHQDPAAPVLPRQISDGLVEIAWCFPDGGEQRQSPVFPQKPVALANLRGDLESFWTQFGFLVEVSTAVFFFTDCLGEKEWDLLMFLGEAAIARCYFVLSPRARESEEAQVFQRLLQLKPSQLLFWEEPEDGDRTKTVAALQPALQEATSAPLRCVSLEDMAPLARELGIHVDQDFEIPQGVQVAPRAAASENQQRHSQTKSPSGSPDPIPGTESGAQGEGKQSAQNFHPTPAFMPQLEHPSPLPSNAGGNFCHIPLQAPWAMGSQFGPEQKAKWFCPLPLPNPRAHCGGKNFGNQFFQPQRFYPGNRFMNFPGTFSGHHANGTFQRPLISQRAWTHPWRLQTVGALQRPGTWVPRAGHLHSLGSQLARPLPKPQPGKAGAQGTQQTKANAKNLRTSARPKRPHAQSFHPAGASQTQVRPAAHQERPANPAFQPGPQSVSGSIMLPSSQPHSHQPHSQIKRFQPKPSQPAQPSQKKTPQPQASQAKPSPSKPLHPQSSQGKPSPSQPTPPKSHRPHQSQSKPSQPRPTQPKPSHTTPSQAKAYPPRAGPKRAGKH